MTTESVELVSRAFSAVPDEEAAVSVARERE
jgi:hypothetical protein